MCPFLQKGGGGLGSLLKAVLKVLDEPDNDVEVVSVYGGCGHSASPATPPTTPSTCVWVSVKNAQGSFMSPVKLQGLLALHTHQVCPALIMCP